MVVRMVKSAAFAVAMFGLSVAADAATIFNFSFTAPWVLSTQTGSGGGQLYADDLGNGSYRVTSVVGTAKVSATSATTTLNTVSAALFGAPTISGNATSGYSFAGILSGSGVSYNFASTMFDTNYTISSGLRTTSVGTFSLAQVAPVAAVPEIATWMMMIVGFGGIGMMLRAGKSRQLHIGTR